MRIEEGHFIKLLGNLQAEVWKSKTSFGSQHTESSTSYIAVEHDSTD